MAKETEVQFRDIDRHEAREHVKNDMAIILKNVKQFMQEKNISQKELASRIGSEPPHVSRMLKVINKNGLTINVLGRIARALDVHIYELVK